MEFEPISPLADALPGLVWTALPDGRAEFLNQRWYQYTGLSPDQAIGFGWQSAIHPEDRALVLERWRSFLESDKPGEVEARLRRYDGEYRRFLFSAAPITDQSGRVVKWCGINTDIEERLKAEEALRARESEAELGRAYAQLTVAQRLSKTGSFTSDLLRDEHIWSDEFYRICEFEPGSKVTIRRLRDILHPEDMRVYDAAVERGIAGHDVDFQFRIITPRGTVKHLHGAARVIEFIAGRPVFMGAVQDTTESKVAEEALRASERNARLIVDSIPGLVAVFTSGGELELVNRQILEYYGKTLEELKRWEISDTVHPQDIARAIEAFTQSITSGDPFDFEVRAQRFDGVYRWLQSRGFPLRDANGHIIRWYNLLIDIDERKRAEEALKAREAELMRANQYLTVAQELSQTGSYARDVPTDEQTLSDQMYRIMEFDPAKKVTHEMVLGRIHPEDLPAFEGAQRVAMEAGKDFEMTYRIVTGSGAVKHLHSFSRRVAEITDRLVYIGATQDVTEIKLAEEALNKARAELTHAARVMTLGALTASIAHEVNQPLSGIITNASTCLRMLAADPPNLDGARATAQRTLRDGNRASEIIQRLRAMFAHKERTAESVDLNEAAREVLALSLSELQRSGVILRTDFDESLPAVTGDRVQLQQVILNLILNAADAMRAIDDRPRELLVTTASEDANRVRLSVRDSGLGIDPENFAKLFDAFYTTKSDGMGVGLSISRSIIESHEGRLWATANDGPGATFSFSIPSGSESATGLENTGTQRVSDFNV